MYNLDFETMRQIIQEHKQTGELSAHVPSIARIRGPCHIQITVQAGTITSCIMKNDHGDYMTGVEAIKQLSRLGSVRWTFVPKAQSPATTTVLLIPRIIALPGQVQMRTWSRLHKLVYSLSNGSANSMQIAKTLAVPVETVEQALRELEAINVLEIERH